MKKLKYVFRVLFCACLILQSSTTIAQSRTITGIIINAITGNPLPNVKVEILNAPVSAISNSSGKYTLTIPDTLKEIKFSGFPGMDILEVKYISPCEINIYLSEVNMTDLSIEQLLNIKVTTAGKTEQKILDIPASVLVITREDIEAYGYQSFKEILSNVLGMYKIDDYKSVGFGVRGFFLKASTRNIIFMVNGLKQQESYLTNNNLDLMNIQVESIDRIEIVRGPAGIIYGNDAFFGAINIITHQKDQRSKSSVNTSYGTYNTYRGNVQITSATENSLINLSAGHYSTDGPDIPFNKILDSVQRYDNTWIKNASTKDFFSQNSKYMNLSIENKGFYSMISYDETDRHLMTRWAPVFGTEKPSSHESMVRGRIGFRKELHPKFSFDMYSGFEKWDMVNTYNKICVIPDVKYGSGRGKASKIYASVVTFIKPAKKMNITLGADYTAVPLGYLGVDIPDLGIDRNMDMLTSSCISYSGYSQAEYEIFPTTRIVAGIRAEKQNSYNYKTIKYKSNVYNDTNYTYKDDKWVYTQQVALLHNITPENIIKLMYSGAVSRPGLLENSFSSGITHSLLKPQTISCIELNYSSTRFTNLFFSLSCFYNKLSKLINWKYAIDRVTGNVINVSDNSGKMVTCGGEFQVIYKPTDKLKFDVSMSYQKTRNKTRNREAAYSPNVLGYLKAIYTIRKDIVFGLSCYYVGSMKSKSYGTRRGRTSKTSPAYLNLGANLRFNHIFKSGLYFSLHADNLLNTDIFYPPTTQNMTYLPNGTYETGIKLNAVLGLKF